MLRKITIILLKICPYVISICSYLEFILALAGCISYTVWTLPNLIEYIFIYIVLICISHVFKFCILHRLMYYSCIIFVLQSTIALLITDSCIIQGNLLIWHIISVLYIHVCTYLYNRKIKKQNGIHNRIDDTHQLW